jgi:nitrite reductase/ring-hydroxylating ferredoxin subunit
MQGAVLNDEFFESLESSIIDVNSAQSLPPLCYTNREFFEFEKEALFYHDWLCVGRESWIPKPGDYFTMSHVGEPLIVLRNREGVIKCLSAVCQHRAMFVVEGHGNARGFTCPYHHWSYSLDGKLMGAPAMERACNFSKEQIRLPEFKVETWLGFIFMNFDSDASPLAPRLETVTKALANYCVASAEGLMATESPKFAWNWKVMFENNNDGYHANRLHHGPIHDICPSSMAVFPDLPSSTAGYFRFNGTVHIDAGFNPTLKAVLPIFPSLTEEERGRMLFANIPPSLTLFARSDMISYNIFHAHGPDETSVHRGWLVAPGAMGQPLFKERLDLNTAASTIIGEQDLHVDACVQIGLRSRYAPRGRYSWQERAQSDLNKWLVQHYRACWQRNGSRQ